jgi:hypothetical protein
MEEQDSAGESKPRKTWFIERTGDGFIFATDELDAWNLLTDKSRWRRHDFKIVGVSTGDTYFKILREGKQEAVDLTQEREKLSSDLAKYTATEDRLRFTELKDDTDDSVIKVTKIINDLKQKLADVDTQLNNFTQLLTKRAFDTELELARGHIEFPSNHDIITPVKADRDKILSNLKV